MYRGNLSDCSICQLL